MTAETTTRPVPDPAGPASSGGEPVDERHSGPSLSPSRAADFKTCPLLFRFRTIDRLPQQPSTDQARGTLVHAVLERLFDLPPAERTPVAAAGLVAPEWARLVGQEPALGELFAQEAAAERATAEAARATTSPAARAISDDVALFGDPAEPPGPAQTAERAEPPGPAQTAERAERPAPTPTAERAEPSGLAPTTECAEPPGLAPNAERAVARPGLASAAEWAVAQPALVDVPMDPTDEAARLAAFLGGAGTLLDGYFAVEDPRRLEPAERESLVSTLVDDELLIRGYIDRLDVSPAGDLRVVDYKTGGAPREAFEGRALFQLKFYALVLWRTRGVVPKVLRLLYLKDAEVCDYSPDAEELERFERTLVALSQAVERAKRDRDFRPKPSRLCGWCSYHEFCPEFGGTIPPYPEPDPPDDAPPPDAHVPGATQVPGAPPPSAQVPGTPPPGATAASDLTPGAAAAASEGAFGAAAAASEGRPEHLVA